VRNTATTRIAKHIGNNTNQNKKEYSNYYLQQVKQKKNQSEDVNKFEKEIGYPIRDCITRSMTWGIDYGK